MLSVAGTQTSGTYQYNTPETRVIIDNAFRRLGRSPGDPARMVSEELAAANEFANMILQSWPNRGINLWLRRTAMMALTPYQATYALPLYTTSVREVLRRQSVVSTTNGTATATNGGNADNAFNGLNNANCDAGTNGTITYTWPYPILITLVGIISFTTTNYTLNFVSGNTTPASSKVVLSVPEQQYVAGQLYWFEIPTPVSGNIFQCVETGGSDLNVTQLYFNYQVQDIPLARISEADYMRFPNKSSNFSAPSNFFVDLQINPVISFYPAPSPTYNNIFFSYQTQVQDFGTMQQYAQIPARFINALTAELAYYLALQYAPDKAALLEVDVKRQYDLAHNSDRERVPLRVTGDYQQGGIS